VTRILFLGDVFARIGRRLAANRLPGLVGRESVDLALANSENAAGGLGLTLESARELFEAGLQGLTGGNHTFRHKEIEPLLDSDARLVRPANYPAPCPGRGWTILETPGGVKVGLGNLMGRVYLSSALECPFRTADRLLAEMKQAGAQITIIDFHAEATSEKNALAWHLDGRLGALVGTHTHVQTSDARLMPGGLAFITDVGMTGPRQSVIGMARDEVLWSFFSGRHRVYQPAKGDPVLEGALLDFDEQGRALSIKALRLEGFSS
jgi:metallophosphoesterase (TIGR00282 family)